MATQSIMTGSWDAEAEEEQEKQLSGLVRGGDHLEVLRFLREHRRMRRPELVLEHAKALMGKIAAKQIVSPSDDELASLGIFVKREQQGREELGDYNDDTEMDISTLSHTFEEAEKDYKRNSITSLSQPSLAGTSITLGPTFEQSMRRDSDRLTFIPMESITTMTTTCGDVGDEHTSSNNNKCSNISEMTTERVDRGSSAVAATAGYPGPLQNQEEYSVKASNYAKLEAQMEQMINQQQRTVQALGDLTCTMADLMKEQTSMMMKTTTNKERDLTNTMANLMKEQTRMMMTMTNKDHWENGNQEEEKTAMNLHEDRGADDHQERKKNQQGKLEVDRATVRLDGLEVYAVVSALTVAMAISCFDVVNSTSTTSNILLVEQINRDNIITLLLNMIYLIICGVGILAGLHSTLVFSLMTMYGRTAVGVSHDKAFVEFLARTGAIRYRGFQSFRFSLYCFLLQVVFTMCSNCPPVLRPLMGVIYFVSIWKVYKDTEGVIQLAGEVLFPLTKKSKNPDETNEGQKSPSGPVRSRRRKKQRDTPPYTKQTSPAAGCSDLPLKEEEKVHGPIATVSMAQQGGQRREAIAATINHTSGKDTESVKPREKTDSEILPKSIIISNESSSSSPSKSSTTSIDVLPGPGTRRFKMKRLRSSSCSNLEGLNDKSKQEEDDDDDDDADDSVLDLDLAGTDHLLLRRRRTVRRTGIYYSRARTTPTSGLRSSSTKQRISGLCKAGIMDTPAQIAQITGSSGSIVGVGSGGRDHSGGNRLRSSSRCYSPVNGRYSRSLRVGNGSHADAGVQRMGST